MSNLVMKKNEYNDFIKEKANETWKKVFAITGGIGKEITEPQKKEVNDLWKAFNIIISDVEVEDFDLSKYNLSIDRQKIINANFKRETLTKNKHKMLIGSSSSEEYWYKLTEDLKLNRHYGYFYSGWCDDDSKKMILKYCESNLFLLLFDNDQEYDTELASTIKYYEDQE